MPRARKENKPLNVRLRIDIAEKLERFCAETGQPKTVAVERFLENGLNEYFDKREDERRPN